MTVTSEEFISLHFRPVTESEVGIRQRNAATPEFEGRQSQTQIAICGGKSAFSVSVTSAFNEMREVNLDPLL